MALLSLGNSENDLANKSLLDVSPLTDVTLDATFQLTERNGADSESGLLTPGFEKPGNFSPAYSPCSVASEDSGILSSAPDNDYLLSSLFGVDFSLLPSTSEAQELLNPPRSTMPEPSKVESITTLATPQGFNVDRNRKNAEAARLNRQKKKRYVEDLEKTCSAMKTENVILKTRCHEYQQKCLKLQSEVQYLKSVLVNESALSSLIQNIPEVKGVKLSSSFSRKRSLSADEENLSAKRHKQSSHSGGVCLHVAKDVVSLEFCASCSKQASS